MLEVKHLKRVYKIKNNKPVYALNDVSLKFQESGLVFILGKSGSGKSTLLNVMGGLDKADEGEIIIEGKSSKDFSSAEMDSYRNTYLGFIFQEYNILGDFTVKENVALALQLQHKKATDEAIDAILEQVDLKGYGKRKPNELSGGQKQRVAIARALVKEPKIIFGDEPTGALDSNTGRQVFETLKKLSKDKLVIIVSHDRDFAEHFGDRVIELKDGQVISDITKTPVEAEEARAGVTLLGDSIIRIEKGHELTAEDLPLLNKALQSSGEDMFISADAHVNDAFCEAARIDKDGRREEFVDTDPSAIKTSEGKFSSIKSHFSFGRAFKMGARSLKVKPFRLVMTILLSTIAFSLFGASASLANFNKTSAVKETIQSESLSSLCVAYFSRYSLGFTSSVCQEIESSAGTKVYPVHSNYFGLGASSPKQNDCYHLTNLLGSIDYTDTLMEDLGLSLWKGNLPSAENEAMISEYAYRSYKDLGIEGTGYLGVASLTPDQVEPESIIGRTLNGYKIVGIFDSSFPAKYDQYRENSSKLTYTDAAYSALNGLKSSVSAHTVLITYPSASSSVSATDAYYADGSFYSLTYDPSHDRLFYFESGKTSLESGEVLVNPYYDGSKGDGGSSSVSLSFPGAYMGTVKEEANLYSIQGWDIASIFNSLSSIVRQAALYRVASDKYEDFYANHLDTIKAINEGKLDGVYEGQGLYYSEPADPDSQEIDYSAMDAQMKYDFLYIYLNNLVAVDEADSNAFYYSEYQSAFAEFETLLLSQAAPTACSQIAYPIQYWYEDAASSYLDSHSSELVSAWKKDPAFVQYMQMFSGEDDVSGFDDARIIEYLSRYFQNEGKSRIPEEMREYVQSSVQSNLSKLDLSRLKTTLTVQEYAGRGETYETPLLGEEKTLRIVGIDLDLNDTLKLFGNEADAKAQKDRLESLGISSADTPNTALVAFGKSEAKIDSFLKFFFGKEDAYSAKSYDDLTAADYYLYSQNNAVSQVISAASMIGVLTQVFLYVGLAMALFSVLLFYNFISVSINNKKREIGILRAVGAKRSDVFKIFYSEALVIAAINFVLSVFVTIFVSIRVNASFRSSLGVSFSLMSPNIWTVLMLLGISVFASILSSSLPVAKLANKKPIDAIQNR